jgi:integrase/recombinase XerC/integrase/recombinase XerD
LRSAAALTIADVQDLSQAWIDDGEVRHFRERTIDERRRVLGKLLWFLRDREAAECGVRETRAFLAYVSRGHTDTRGRWGNDQCRREVKPATVKAYYRVLHSFSSWLEEAGELEGSLIAGIKPPLLRDDQIQPFTREQVGALLEAARRGYHPKRNEALVMFMVDTGARASEVCAVKVSDLDLTARKVKLQGKGDKQRVCYLGRQGTRLLWAYLREAGYGAEGEPARDVPLFTSERGPSVAEALTRSGVGFIIRSLGKEAKLNGVRCSPHTLRHTFAVEFLRAGGNVFALKELLGHTSLTMTNRYVALASADLEAQHRQFSPGDRIKRR